MANPWESAEQVQTAPKDPWSNAEKTQDVPKESNPWGTPKEGEDSSPFQEAPELQESETSFNFLDPFQEEVIPFANWVESGLNYVVENFRDFFQMVKYPIDTTLTSIESFLLAVPAFAVIVFFALLAWQISSKKLALGAVLSLVFIGLIGAWDEAMVTLALVITSVLFSIVLGIPLGVWTARSDKVDKVVRPILDAMQTTPAFVYLIPIVMLFGIGNVPGVIVTIIFALPPLIRLTNLGIRQVPQDLIEASRAFGANKKQMLFKVQLPVAMPTIMAGVNQTLMLALSMVVIASMIAVGGLGQMVLRGIGRLDIGLAAVGGIGIVLLAVVLDRLTQALGEDVRSKASWYEKGPVGILYKLIKKEK